MSLSCREIISTCRMMLSVILKVSWYDLARDEVLFEKQISSWGSYTPGVDISLDGLDNDGDGLIDSEDSDENGAPRDTAKSIADNKISESILAKITSNLNAEGVSIETMLQIPDKNIPQEQIPIIIITHETTKNILKKALINIEKLDFVLDNIAVITIDKNIN